MKHWLSPSSWSNYFHGGADGEDADSSISPPPQNQNVTPPTTSNCLQPIHNSEDAVISKEMVIEPPDGVSVPDHQGRIFTPIPEFTFPKPSLSASPDPNPFSRSEGVDQGEASSVNHYLQPPVPELDSTDDSDASWIAEACKEVTNEGQCGGPSNGDDSWVAEADEKSVGDCQVPRPMSITLAKEELTRLSGSATPTPLYTYAVGEGQAGVAEQSGFLLTPGAETKVHYVANPVYADKSSANRTPEVHLPASEKTRGNARRKGMSSGMSSLLSKFRPAMHRSVVSSLNSTPVMSSLNSTAHMMSSLNSTAPQGTSEPVDREQEVVSVVQEVETGVYLAVIRLWQILLRNKAIMLCSYVL